MTRTRRRGDKAGISLLIALLATAFVPATLDEAGRALALLRARAPLGGEVGHQRAAPPPPELRVGLPTPPAPAELEREGQCSVGALPGPAGMPPKAAVLGAGRAPGDGFVPPTPVPRNRKPRGPPSA